MSVLGSQCTFDPHSTGQDSGLESGSCGFSTVTGRKKTNV